jgi:hypothetical protein
VIANHLVRARVWQSGCQSSARMKTCKVCGNEKPLEEFSIHSGFKDGRNSVCKACRNVSEKKKRVAGQRKHTPYTYKQQLKARYGLSMTDYEGMVLLQEGACAICGETGKPLNVDHCHTTGVVRGLLCTKCNTALGKFGDDVKLLQKAIEYLKNMESSVQGTK